MTIRLIGILVPVLALGNASVTSGSRDVEYAAWLGREFDYTLRYESDPSLPCVDIVWRVVLPDALAYVSSTDLTDGRCEITQDKQRVTVRYVPPTEHVYSGDVARIRVRAVREATRAKPRLTAQYRLTDTYLAKQQRVRVDVRSINAVTVKDVVDGK